MDSKNIVIIEKFRKKFLNDSEANPKLYHQIDVERVRSENWQIERFILEIEAEDKAYKALTDAMKWKKSFGIHERNDKYFPKEFFLVFDLEISGRDKEGRLVIWNSDKNFKKMSNMSLIFKQFFAHQIEKIDRLAGDKGWTHVFNASASGLTNFDMSLNQFRSEISNYYPQGSRLILNVDMPRVMNSAFKLALNFLSQKMRDSVKLIRKEELLQFFDIDVIPVSLGGNRDFQIPKTGDVFPLYQLKHLGLNDKEINNFYNVFQNVFVREID
jgi:hypothetical protein